mmetsp:Transcript_17615/g.25336  ORF Transcript_17615/g.25336 Transcript_17615/m.25336 type:complete len:109 (+) Transcript_17615:468-794(+)
MCVADRENYVSIPTGSWILAWIGPLCFLWPSVVVHFEFLKYFGRFGGVREKVLLLGAGIFFCVLWLLWLALGWRGLSRGIGKALLGSERFSKGGALTEFPRNPEIGKR